MQQRRTAQSPLSESSEIHSGEPSRLCDRASAGRSRSSYLSVTVLCHPQTHTFTRSTALSTSSLSFYTFPSLCAHSTRRALQKRGGGAREPLVLYILPEKTDRKQSRDATSPFSCFLSCDRTISRRATLTRPSRRLAWREGEISDQKWAFGTFALRNRVWRAPTSRPQPPCLPSSPYLPRLSTPATNQGHRLGHRQEDTLSRQKQ